MKKEKQMFMTMRNFIKIKMQNILVLIMIKKIMIILIIEINRIQIMEIIISIYKQQTLNQQIQSNDFTVKSDVKRKLDF